MVSSLEASAKTPSHDQHHYFTSFTAIPLSVTFNHYSLVTPTRLPHILSSLDWDRPYAG